MPLAMQQVIASEMGLAANIIHWASYSKNQSIDEVIT